MFIIIISKWIWYKKKRWHLSANMNNMNAFSSVDYFFAPFHGLAKIGEFHNKKKSYKPKGIVNNNKIFIRIARKVCRIYRIPWYKNAVRKFTAYSTTEMKSQSVHMIFKADSFVSMKNRKRDKHFSSCFDMWLWINFQ